MSLWLYLHFPTLQLDSIFSDQDTLTPLVIVATNDHKIKQANKAAKELGIQIGMGLASAAALCSQLQVIPYDLHLEQHRLEELAHSIYRLTSDVVLFPPQGIALRVSPMLTLYRGLDHYWQTLQQHLDSEQVTYSFSTGFSPYASMLLAKSETNIICEDKQTLLTHIHTLPLIATELSTTHIRHLQRVGVDSLQRLFSMPMTELARRFDIHLTNYVGRLLGTLKHPMVFFHPKERFSAQVALLYDIDNQQWLMNPIQRLLQRLELFLVMRNQVAYELQLQFSLRVSDNQSPTHTLDAITSAQGESRASHWRTLIELSLENLVLTAPVHSLQLMVMRCGEAQNRSEDLFERHSTTSGLTLISQLQARLGRAAVSRVELTSDPRPEKRLQRIDASLPAAFSTSPSPTPQLLRPSFLFTKPRPLHEKVHLTQGPERFATGWWDGNFIQRDYYVARNQQGQWLWVFRTQENQWFIHGLFS